MKDKTNTTALNEMKTLKYERYSDLANPLLVREVRQALRSKSFAAIILINALASGFVMFLFVIHSQNGTTGHSSAGPASAGIILLGVWFVSCWIVPNSAMWRFYTEKDTGEFGLFVITGISPIKIIIGKLQAALTKSFLVICISAPFVFVSYLLTGVSLLDILLIFMMIVAYTVLMTQCGLLLAALPMSKSFILLGILLSLGLGLLALPLGGATLFGELSKMFGNNDFMIIGIGLVMVIYISLILFFSTLYLLETPLKNRTIVLRILISFSVVALACVSLWLESQYQTGMFVFKDILEVVVLFSSLVVGIPILLTMLLMFTPKTPTPLPAQQVWQKRNWFVRLLKPFLYPGCGSAMLWFWVTMSIIVVVAIYQNYQETEVDLMCLHAFFWTPLLIMAMVGAGLQRLIDKTSYWFLGPAFAWISANLLALILLSSGALEQSVLMVCPFTSGLDMYNNWKGDNMIYSSSIRESMGLMLIGAIFWVSFLCIAIWLHVLQLKTDKKFLIDSQGVDNC